VAPQAVWDSPICDLVDWFRHAERIQKALKAAIDKPP
jgi:hypothetical protein